MRIQGLGVSKSFPALYSPSFLFIWSSGSSFYFDISGRLPSLLSQHPGQSSFSFEVLFLNQFGCVSRSNILLWAGLAGQRWIEGQIDLSSSGTGPSIDHRAYSTLAEWILLKRNVNFISCCISLVWKFQNVVCGFLIKSSPLICHLIDRAAHHSSRPRTGSNRHSRICSPIHFHYVT